MCPPSVSTGEHVNMIIYSGGQTSAVSRAGIANVAGTDVTESHVMLVSHRRGVRTDDCQGVLAVLQQGSPVNDAKYLTKVRSTINDDNSGVGTARCVNIAKKK